MHLNLLRSLSSGPAPITDTPVAGVAMGDAVTVWLAGRKDEELPTSPV